jgi:hypothetical protein
MRVVTQAKGGVPIPALTRMTGWQLTEALLGKVHVRDARD